MNMKQLWKIWALMGILCACAPQQNAASSESVEPVRSTATARNPVASSPVSASAVFALPTPNQQQQTDANRPLLAHQAVELFFHMCVATGADEQQISQLAEQHRLLAFSEQQKQEFGFNPEVKQVWGGNSRAGGSFMVIVGSNNGAYCSVKARFADANIIHADMKQLAEQLAQQLNLNLETKPMHNTAQAQSPNTEQQVFVLSKPQAPNDFMLLSFTHPQSVTEAMLVFHIVPR